jgi:hypothetical protein
MFPAVAFTPEWINAQRKQLGGCDPGILETCIHALTLLGLLVESGLPFLFKGGTSLLLHLPQTRRLSRDIDIVCALPAAEVDAVLAVLGQRAPFLRHEEDVRGVRGLPRRRHFKFFYRSALPGYAEQPVLLDIVEESREVHAIVTRPIRTSFLTPEREVLVRVPTVESLLGDKLTAFAPTTTGVPLRVADNSDGDVQQVAKQLFDVGVLFEAASDFGKIAEAYDAIWALESEYRPTHPSREATLNDTWDACLALTATKKKHLAAYPDAALLHSGLDRMGGHLTWPEFVRDREPRRLLAARAAVIVAHLRAGRSLDFATARYTGSPAQLAALRAANLNGTAYDWINGLKAVNPEAYHYWHMALSL